MTEQINTEKENIILRMHPLQRILTGLIITLLTFIFIRRCQLTGKLIISILWDAFALSYLTINWIVLFTRKQSGIVKQANKDDGSRIFVLASILITSIASMCAVTLLLLTPKDEPRINEFISYPVAILGMLLSWAMVHTLFTFHYAHLYYEGYQENKMTGLDFPGDQKPDYLDFAYFSFVIGMTFQVSDVEINSSKIRRTVLAHGLLAFVLNTFVVALTINLIAGLKS